jgi:hypothetical protein
MAKIASLLPATLRSRLRFTIARTYNSILLVLLDVVFIQAVEEFLFLLFHDFGIAMRCLMIVSEKVKNSMYHEKVNFIFKGDGMIISVSFGSFC